MKLKSFCTTKEIVTRQKRHSTECKKIFTSCTSDKGLINRIYREIEKLNNERINNSLNKGANELNRQFSKEVQIANKSLKKCSTSLVIRKCKSK
jgi:guanylate kinase